MKKNVKKYLSLALALSMFSIATIPSYAYTNEFINNKNDISRFVGKTTTKKEIIYVDDGDGNIIPVEIE